MSDTDDVPFEIQQLDFRQSPGAMILMFILSLVTYQLVRHVNVLMWLFCAVLTPVLIPLFGIYKLTTWTWFTWAKLFSLMIAIVYLQILRVWNRSCDRNWTRILFWIILAANIAEASARDLQLGFVANGLLGFFLILTQSGHFAISLEKTDSTKDQNTFCCGDNRIRSSSSASEWTRFVFGKPPDLYWDLGMPWALSYTLWNWSFVFSSTVHDIASNEQFVILAVPIAQAWVDERLWFQARTITLAVYFIAQAAFRLTWNLSWIPPITDDYVNQSEYYWIFVLLGWLAAGWHVVRGVYYRGWKGLFTFGWVEQKERAQSPSSASVQLV